VKNLIEINAGVLTISPEALMIKEFKKIWTRDRSTKKDRALKELAYVYHSTDYQSIYRNYHIDTRDSKIKLDIFDDRQWTSDNEINEALNKYQNLQTTLSMQLLNDVELGLSKLRDYFRDIEFADDDTNGVAAKNFIGNVKAMGELVKGIKTLRDEVEKELTDNMQLRGRTEIATRELPPDRRG
jgi:chaperonin cofactor prefoldin